MPCKHEGGTDPCRKNKWHACLAYQRQWQVDHRESRKEYRKVNRVHKRQIDQQYTRDHVETVRGVSPGAIGAAGELLVRSDLLLRGFSVTTPCDPSARHDLHVEVPSVGWVGVQVKVVKVNIKTGRWYWKYNSRNSKVGPQSPIYALVRLATKEIHYEGGTEPLPAELA